MLRFGNKMGTEHSKEWRCLMCLHVRTGTMLLGSWHLVLHLLALGFLAAVVRDPTLIEDFERDQEPFVDWHDVGSPLPTALPNIESPSSVYTQYAIKQKERSFIYHDIDVGGLVTVCTLAITLMLIYGAARGKPAHILPFFCLQIFDFAITVLTGMGYLCYVRSVDRLVREARRVPWRAQLLTLPVPALAFVILCSFLLAITIKAYFIDMVWRCYKYLTMRSHALGGLTPFVISGEGLALPSSPTPAPLYSSLLPDYDEAVKQTPPPSYRAATLMAQVSDTVVVLPQPGAPAPV